MRSHKAPVFYTNLVFRPRPWWLFWLSDRAWITLNKVIYHPRSVKDPKLWPEVVAHEATHVHQQIRIGWHVFVWRYLMSRKARLGFEAESFAAELLAHPEFDRARVMVIFSEALASSAYLWAAKDAAEGQRAIERFMLGSLE